MREVFKALISDKFSFAYMLAFLIICVAGAIAPYVAPYDPQEMIVSEMLKPPSTNHFFGTDNFGRDVLSRILYGINNSLVVGAMVVMVNIAFGGVAGAIAAYFRKLDWLIMRTMDIMMCFPSIILAIAIVAILGPSLSNAIIAISIVYIPRTARVTYGVTLQIMNEDFIEGARAIGAKHSQILLKHIAPNIVAPLVVQSTYTFALAILIEAGLSFLGAGTPPPAPSLGNMLSEARTYMRFASWMMFSPGLAIVLLVLSVNLLGDALRDVLDPKLKRKTVLK